MTTRWGHADRACLGVMPMATLAAGRLRATISRRETPSAMATGRPASAGLARTQTSMRKSGMTRQAMRRGSSPCADTGGSLDCLGCVRERPTARNLAEQCIKGGALAGRTQFGFQDVARNAITRKPVAGLPQRRQAIHMKAQRGERGQRLTPAAREDEERRGGFLRLRHETSAMMGLQRLLVRAVHDDDGARAAANECVCSTTIRGSIARPDNDEPVQDDA